PLGGGRRGCSGPLDADDARSGTGDLRVCSAHFCGGEGQVPPHRLRGAGSGTCWKFPARRGVANGGGQPGEWSRILRNVLSNWTSYVVTALVGFGLTPVVVHSLGNTGYGLWTLVVSMTGYFGLLDLGIRSSVGRFVTRYIALKDDEGANRIVSTAF